jgi:putative Mg2+ transporter-C (MgtC) family protein
MNSIWEQILSTVQQEFSDLSDGPQLTRVVVRLGLALLLGAVIGYERERRGVDAGLRTHMLVAVGTAVFVLVPQQAGMDADQLSRVLQGIAAGIGFLGAGTVLKLGSLREIRGLTTAAGIWTTAAIGIAVGLGRESTAVLTTIIVLVVFSLIRVEQELGTREKKSDDDAEKPGEPDQEKKVA